jgi:hypothetical protein
MQVDVNDMLTVLHDAYGRQIRDLTHEVAVLRLQLAAATTPKAPDTDAD